MSNEPKEPNPVEIDHQNTRIIVHSGVGPLANLPPSVPAVLQVIANHLVGLATKTAQVAIAGVLEVVGAVITGIAVGLPSIFDQVRLADIERIHHFFEVEVGMAQQYRDPMRKIRLRAAAKKYLEEMSRYTPISVTVEEIVEAFV
jgi:hypothetical protein